MESKTIKQSNQKIMYIPYHVDFTLAYYKSVKDLQLKFKALKRLKLFKKNLKAGKRKTALRAPGRLIVKTAI